MTQSDEIVRTVRAELEREPRIAIHRHPVTVSVDANGALVLEGEVGDLAAKKLAMERAATAPGVHGIVDRLHVAPGERMQDGAIVDRVTGALLQEHPLERFTIRVQDKGRWRTVREPVNASGEIEVEVKEGVVTLNGRLPSHTQKRLAGVMAWWVAGTRDVINGIEVLPAEQDEDGDLVDAIRLVLEEDPFVNASQIVVGSRDYVVTLDGMVRNETEKRMAERDAWFVYGVDDVVNRLRTME